MNQIKSQIIAIDGPAASGKSTIARLLAEKLSIPYLDTGALFRSVTWIAIHEDCDINDEEALASFALKLPEYLSKVSLSENSRFVYYNDKNITDEIRSEDVTQLVSYVAASVSIRLLLRQWQIAWIQNNNAGVLDGRDIGTVIFPETPYKFYVDASPEIRASRRALQSGLSPEKMLEDILFRDALDQNRKNDPLKIANDAIIIDTSQFTIDEVLETMYKHVIRIATEHEGGI